MFYEVAQVISTNLQAALCQNVLKFRSVKNHINRLIYSNDKNLHIFETQRSCTYAVLRIRFPSTLGKLFTHNASVTKQIIWYRPMGGNVLRPAGKGTVGLSSHWQCVADSTCGLTAKKGRRTSRLHCAWGTTRTLYLFTGDGEIMGNRSSSERPATVDDYLAYLADLKELQAFLNEKFLAGGQLRSGVADLEFDVEYLDVLRIKLRQLRNVRRHVRRVHVPADSHITRSSPGPPAITLQTALLSV